MGIGRAISGRTEDFGPILQLPCPQCDTEQWFYLKEHSSHMSLLGLQMGKSCSFSLHCSQCEFPVDLQNEDAEKAVRFLPISQSFLKNERTEEAFIAELQRAEFIFLNEIEQANTNWICPGCGEESPLTFSACWNCGGPHEAKPADS